MGEREKQIEESEEERLSKHLEMVKFGMKTSSDDYIQSELGIDTRERGHLSEISISMIEQRIQDLRRELSEKEFELKMRQAERQIFLEELEKRKEK